MSIRRSSRWGAAFLALCMAARASVASASPPIFAARDTNGRTLGVVPFDVDPLDTLLAPLAYGLPDLLTTDLARSKQLTIVERSHLNTVLRELDLVRAGSVAAVQAPRLGRLIAAERLIVGSLRRRGPSTIVFEARVADVRTGLVLQTMTASAPVDDILAAEKDVALRMFTYLGVVLTPQERALVEQRPTRNLAALVAYGQGAKAEVNGQYALALRSFRAAAKLDPGFASASAREKSVRGALPNPALTAAINGVNRPLETIPTSLERGLAIGSSFPVARGTIIVNISRP